MINNWIDVKDSKPVGGQKVLVLINKRDIAVADYDIDFGFQADDSGYNISMDDDSGLRVFLCDNITH